jgi:CubicO group peptidase (beta-lactamase class C family)
MITSATLADGEQTGFGFGLVVKAVLNKPAIWHDGVVSGYSSRLVYYPDDELAVVLLSNVTNSKDVGPLEGLEALYSQQWPVTP